MSLKDILGDFKTEFVIKFGDKEHRVDVYPLNLKDIADLIGKHGGILKELLGANKGISDLFAEAPEFALSVIAKGIRETDMEIVGSIPAGIQLHLFEKVAEISQISPEYVGKLVARLIGVMEAGVKSVNSLNLTNLKKDLKVQSTDSSQTGIKEKK